MKYSIFGFTLIEMLVTISILVVMLAIGVPSFQYLMAKNEADQTIIRLYRAIQLTRSTAIKHHCLVTICGSDNDQTCSSDWSHGYMIFIDKQGKGQISSNNQLIKVFHISSNGGQLTWRGFPNQPYLQMTPQGFTHNQNGTFRYFSKSKDPRFIRSLIINQSGRMRFGE